MVYIIIVTFNGIKWIEKCLHSLVQTTIPFHTIVVDNGSTDGTIEFIQKHYSDIELIISEENLGFGAANNIGMQKALNAQAAYVFLLNQDCYIQPDTLKNLVDIHQKNEDFGILSPIHLTGNELELDYNFSTYLSADRCENLLSDLYLNKLQNLYGCDFLNAASWLISKDCLRKVGLFDPLFFHYSEDRNYCHRVLFHGFKIGVCPTNHIIHDRESRKGVHSNFKGNQHYLNEVKAGLLDIRKPSFSKDFGHIILLNLFNALKSLCSLNIKAFKIKCQHINYLLTHRTAFLKSRKGNQKHYQIEQ